MVSKAGGFRNWVPLALRPLYLADWLQRTLSTPDYPTSLRALLSCLTVLICEYQVWKRFL
jgi:hypothetical protein